MPLRELIRDFDDRLKSASQGYASFTYELAGEQESEVEKLEILIVNEVVPALTRIVPKKDIELRRAEDGRAAEGTFAEGAIFAGDPGALVGPHHRARNDPCHEKRARQFREERRRPHAEDEAMAEAAARQGTPAEHGARGAFTRGVQGDIEEIKRKRAIINALRISIFERSNGGKGRKL